VLESPPAPRPTALILAESRDTISPAYRAAIDTLPADVRRVAGYHIGWWDADGRPSNAAGKAVRPALLLACARAAGGNEVAHDRATWAAAVNAAVAVELVHDFSLLHDDVMDEDPNRRHRPAAWAAFGVGRAVLTGDALFALAMDLLRDGALPVLTRAALELCAGQSADLALEDRGAVTLSQCVAVAEGKTGALLGAACQLGALAGGATDRVARCYQRFGRQLGVAFQLVDDMLNLWGDPDVTGKPAGSDLARLKKSLPVAAALNSGTAAGKELARLYAQGRPFDERAARHAVTLVEAAGGRAWARAQARRWTHCALRTVERTGPAAGGAADLTALSALLTHRDH